MQPVDCIDDAFLNTASRNRTMTTLTTSSSQPPACKPSNGLLQPRPPAKVYGLPSDKQSSAPGRQQGYCDPEQDQGHPHQPQHQCGGPRSHPGAAVEPKALDYSMAVDLEVAVSGKQITFSHVKQKLITESQLSSTIRSETFSSWSPASSFSSVLFGFSMPCQQKDRD